MPPNIEDIKVNRDSVRWQDLVDLQAINDGELDKIKSHLELVLLALEAIAEISSEAMIRAARDLNLESVVGDRLSLWQMRSSNLKGKSGGRKKLDIEEARSLVLIICHLANQHQELLRRAVSLLEVSQQNKPPHQTALLGNYLDRFINYYQERITDSHQNTPESLSHLAWKLAIDLLFYSGQNGHRLLWVAIFDAARTSPKS